MRISLAITVYNSEQFLDQCIRSVINQSHNNWELVFVDDLSTDNSLQIIQELLKEYQIEDKCKIIQHDKNYGYGKSLKDAIENSTGKLVGILDSDDALYNNNVLKVSNEIHKKYPNVSMTYSNYYLCDLKLDPIKKVKAYTLRSGDGLLTSKKYNGNAYKISHLKVFKKKFYNITDGLDETLVKSVDKDLILKLEEVGSLYHIDKILYLYRRHKNSITAKFRKKTKTERTKIVQSKQRMIESARKRRGYV